MDGFVEYKKRSDYFTPILDQLALAKFMEEIHFEKHIYKMKKVYRKRREALIEALKQHFGDTLTIQGESTGLHLVVSFENIRFTEALVAYLTQEGIKMHPVWQHSSREDYPKNQVIMGYSHLDCETIFKAIHLLKQRLSTWMMGDCKDK